MSVIKVSCAVLIVSLALSDVRANVYMHNPRGSNNRLNEVNANRNNANRLFDSQVRRQFALAFFVSEITLFFFLFFRFFFLLFPRIISSEQCARRVLLGSFHEFLRGERAHNRVDSHSGMRKRASRVHDRSAGARLKTQYFSPVARFSLSLCVRCV